MFRKDVNMASTIRKEKNNFSTIHCLECGNKMESDKAIHTYFLEKEGGLPIYGAVCSKCCLEIKKRKQFIINDGLIKPENIAKGALKIIYKGQTE